MINSSRLIVGSPPHESKETLLEIGKYLGKTAGAAALTCVGIAAGFFIHFKYPTIISPTLFRGAGWLNLKYMESIPYISRLFFLEAGYALTSKEEFKNRDKTFYERQAGVAIAAIIAPLTAAYLEDRFSTRFSLLTNASLTGIGLLIACFPFSASDKYF